MKWHKFFIWDSFKNSLELVNITLLQDNRKFFPVKDVIEREIIIIWQNNYKRKGDQFRRSFKKSNQLINKYFIKVNNAEYQYCALQRGSKYIRGKPKIWWRLRDVWIFLLSTIHYFAFDKISNNIRCRIKHEL